MLVVAAAVGKGISRGELNLGGTKSTRRFWKEEPLGHALSLHIR